MALRTTQRLSSLARLGHRAQPLAPAAAAASARTCAAAAVSQPLANKSFVAGTSPSVLAKDRITLSREEADVFNRWSIFPRIFLVQIPTGAIYAWSMWSLPMTKNLGVLAPAAMDWNLGAVGTTFSCLAIGFGSTVGLLGPWMERAGPRFASMLGGALFGGGHLIAGLGCYTQTLPLVWMGWGIMGGLGWGLGYIAPISAVMKWFPDKKGLATGLSVTAFASGGLLATPLIDELKKHFFKAPIFAGGLGDVEVKTEAGRQFVNFQGDWREAIVAKTNDIATAGMPGEAAAQLSEGYYLIGTGDTGCAIALATLGTVYGTSMLLGGWLMRAPPDGWTPKGWVPAVSSTSGLSAGSVSASAAMRTPQFYLMWLTLAGSCSAGVAVISSAKFMMGDIFASINPNVVTAGFTTAFVGALQVANAGGRLTWASASDYLGRKPTMFVCSLALPACLMVPQVTHLAVAGGAESTTALYLFYGTTFAIVSWYGGVLALIPSYVSDVFGPKQAPVIYGRLMTGWSATAILTPSMLASLKGHSSFSAIESLAAATTPAAFEQAFKAPLSDLHSLVDAKTVTIARLMEIAPPGTVDPTPFIYDSTFYSVSGILAVAAVSNALITKVDSKHFMIEAPAVKEEEVTQDVVEQKSDEEKEKIFDDDSKTQQLR